jgi:hypothetical protein
MKGIEDRSQVRDLCEGGLEALNVIEHRFHGQLRFVRKTLYFGLS